MDEIAEVSPSTIGFPDSYPHPVTSPQGVLEDLSLDQFLLGVPTAKRVERSEVRAAGVYFWLLLVAVGEVLSGYPYSQKPLSMRHKKKKPFKQTGPHAMKKCLR